MNIEKKKKKKQKETGGWFPARERDIVGWLNLRQMYGQSNTAAGPGRSVDIEVGRSEYLVRLA